MSDLSETVQQHEEPLSRWNKLVAYLRRFHTRPSAGGLPLWLFSLFLLIASYFLFTQANDFPFYYHSDESSKVEQIQTKDWKFSHPMLMLTAARHLAEATGAVENGQRVGELGRNVSAFYCAAAVALLAAAVWITAGRFAGIAAGLLLLTNHQLFELSHYLKEDTSLLFGLALWTFGLALFWQRPTPGRAFLIGAGAAAALSGKYLGIFTLPLGLGMIFCRTEKETRLRDLSIAFVTAMIAALLINLPILSQFSDFFGSLKREMALASDGHRGVTRSVPHVVYLTAFKDNLYYALWVPIAWFYLGFCWQRRKALSGVEWLIALLPVLFLVTLSFFPKTNDRYFLPATAFFLCAAAWGLHHFQSAFKIPKGITALLLFLLLGTQTIDLIKYYRAFRKDDLADLTHWLNENLPDATLAIDGKVMLPSPRKPEFAPYQIPLKAKVVKQPVDRYESVEALRADGVTHVILSESSYGRYQSKSLRPKADNKEKFQKRKNLYQEILSDREPLWGADRPRSTVIYLHPGLQVYAITEK